MFYGEPFSRHLSGKQMRSSQISQQLGASPEVHVQRVVHRRRIRRRIIIRFIVNAGEFLRTSADLIERLRGSQVADKRGRAANKFL
jgi:hypothetical protein